MNYVVYTFFFSDNLISKGKHSNNHNYTSLHKTRIFQFIACYTALFS